MEDWRGVARRVEAGSRELGQRCRGGVGWHGRGAFQEGPAGLEPAGHLRTALAGPL